jgi:ketosteroid isomerase-like protein
MTTSIDSRHRKLCHDLFDALEQGDVGAVDALYAPHMTFWANLTPEAWSTREDNLRVLAEGKALHRRRQYNDRIIDTFDDGFLARYTVNVVLHDGSTAALSACLVAEVHDGKIVRLWDYLDSSRFRPRKAKPRSEVPA